jgi:probable F420-dependent oxidoreductase
MTARLDPLEQTTMKFGVGLPHLGHLADPDAIRTVATTVEQAGLSSVWAMDRLLAPLTPRTKAYPGSADGRLPAAQDVVLDPLVALTVAATVTDRIGVGTDVLVAPWYSPVLLARSLAALDQVSRGRLVAGLGLGWSIDEFEAVGTPMVRRGQRLDEMLDVMTTVWSSPIVDIETSSERIAPSVMGLKPTRPAGPPILLAATTAAGLDRIAQRGDGWLPFGVPVDEIASGWAHIGDQAARHGRDPQRLQLVVRADPHPSDVRLGRDRPAFTGTCQQIRDDLDQLRSIGANEVILDLHDTARTVAELLDIAHALTEPPVDRAA